MGCEEEVESLCRAPSGLGHRGQRFSRQRRGKHGGRRADLPRPRCRGECTLWPGNGRSVRDTVALTPGRRKQQGRLGHRSQSRGAWMPGVGSHFNGGPQGLRALSCFSSACSGPCTLERCLCAESVAAKRSGAAESRVATVEMVRGDGHEHSWGD